MIRGISQLPGPKGSESRADFARSERIVAETAKPLEKARIASKRPGRGRAVAAAVAGGAAATAGILRFTRPGGRGGFGGMHINMAARINALMAKPIRKVSQNISGQSRRGGL